MDKRMDNACDISAAAYLAIFIYIICIARTFFTDTSKALFCLVHLHVLHTYIVCSNVIMNRENMDIAHGM